MSAEKGAGKGGAGAQGVVQIEIFIPAFIQKGTPGSGLSCIYINAVVGVQASGRVEVSTGLFQALPDRIAEFKASVLCLAPLHFRRNVIRPVSYYAFFKRWLLLSQRPGCLYNVTTLTTEHRFGDLSC